MCERKRVQYVCMGMHTIRCPGKSEASDPEAGVAGSYKPPDTDAGNWTQVLSNSMCSQLPNHLSSPWSMYFTEVLYLLFTMILAFHLYTNFPKFSLMKNIFGVIFKKIIDKNTRHTLSQIYKEMKTVRVHNLASSDVGTQWQGHCRNRYYRNNEREEACFLFPPVPHRISFSLGILSCVKEEVSTSQRLDHGIPKWVR